MRNAGKILEAACEIAGGRAELANRLGIGEALLRAYMNDGRALPDSLMLKVVDIILADRQAKMLSGQPANSSATPREPNGKKQP